MNTILFLCNDNAARSVIAEAIANQTFGKHLRACSAAPNPAAEIHPEVARVLAEQGLGTEGLEPTDWKEMAGRTFDAVVTMCDDLRDAPRPSFGGEPVCVHWPLPDPCDARNVHDAVEGLHDLLIEAVGLAVHAPDPEFAGRVREAGRQVCRRQAPRAA